MRTICQIAVDYFYGDKSDLSFLEKSRILIHILFCPKCTAEKRKFVVARELLLTSFMPPAPSLTNSVMAMILNEKELKEDTAETVFSLRFWIFAGIFMVLSLASAFFGGDFAQIVKNNGFAFFLPLGITVGVVITVYCALFIASHLDKLCEKFGLRESS